MSRPFNKKFFATMVARLRFGLDNGLVFIPHASFSMERNSQHTFGRNYGWETVIRQIATDLRLGVVNDFEGKLKASSVWYILEEAEAFLKILNHK